MYVLASGYESPVTSSDEEEISLSIKRRKLNNIITNAAQIPKLESMKISQNDKPSETTLKNEKQTGHSQSFTKTISSLLPAPKNNRQMKNETSKISTDKSKAIMIDNYNEYDEETQTIFETLMKKSKSSMKVNTKFRDTESRSIPSSGSELLNAINTDFEVLPIPEIIDPIVLNRTAQDDNVISEKNAEKTKSRNNSRQGIKDGAKIIDFNVNDHYNVANSEKSSYSSINNVNPNDASNGVLKVFNVHGKNQFSSLATYAQDSKNNDILQEKFKREKQQKWKNKQKYGF